MRIIQILIITMLTTMLTAITQTQISYAAHNNNTNNDTPNDTPYNIATKNTEELYKTWGSCKCQSNDPSKESLIMQAPNEEACNIWCCSNENRSISRSTFNERTAISCGRRMIERNWMIEAYKKTLQKNYIPQIPPRKDNADDANSAD